MTKQDVLSTLPGSQVKDLPGHSGAWILAATTLASSTTFLLGAAVNIALPSIQSYFGANISGLEWVTNAQLLFLATLLLIGGTLGDYFGRKRIFVIGMSVFTLASILAGFAPSLGWLIAFQSTQGIGSALMVPQSLAIINAHFPEEKRGRAIGLWAGISGAIAAIGPWLGGWLIEHYSWRAVFFINVPISAASLVIALIFIRESERASERRLDWTGTLFVFLGFLGIAYALITAPVSTWTQWDVLLGLVGGAAAGATFLLMEIRKRNPLVPRHIFRIRLVTGSNLVTLFLYFALNGIFFFLVLNLQQVQGYSPSGAGLGLLVPTGLIALFSGPAGSLSDRIGPRLQMILGPFLVALGAACLALFGNQPGYVAHFLPGLALFGIGMALVIAPLTKSALIVQPEFSGSASGVNNAVARFAALFAIAILGAVMLSVFSTRLEGNISQLKLSPPQQQEILAQSNKLGGIAVPADFSPRDGTAAKELVRDSFMFAYRWAMGICALLAAVAALISSLMIHNPPPTLRAPPSA
jgi:EmrB/QacA subfamily drug resistance transporter